MIKCFHYDMTFNVTMYFKLKYLAVTFLLFFQLEPLGNKTFTQDFTADINLKCPTKVGKCVIAINAGECVFWKFCVKCI